MKRSQWRTLVPTYERRSTRIDDIKLANIQIGKARYMCKIEGHPESPVKDVIP